MLITLVELAIYLLKNYTGYGKSVQEFRQHH